MTGCGIYGRKPVCIFGTQDLESKASHPAHVGVLLLKVCYRSVLLKRIPFLVKFITNCFISLSFWTSVFCRSSSSTMKLESNTICFFIPLNGIIFWHGRTKDAESETVFRLTEFHKGLDGVWSGLTSKSVDTVSWLLFIPVDYDLSWWSKLSKAAIVNMPL